MALDNAQFIAELSVTDPPGTDPLSQGDDHIRTTKRATQQSFPNIDAAVNLTAAQMNEAAIKNEANIFTLAGQQFLDANFIKKNTDTAVAGWHFQDALGINRWSTFISTLANGENFILQRRDNLGVVVDNPWNVSLATGVVDFALVPTVQGAPLWIAGEIRMFVASASPGTNWFLADGTNGTVDLTDRILMNEGFVSVGTPLDATITATQADSGDTALSIAQMPSHDHLILGSGPPGVLAGLQDANARAFAGLGSVTPAFIDQTGFGDNLMQNTGSGNAHSHTVPIATLTDPTFSDSVRPLSQVVQMHQYVP